MKMQMQKASLGNRNHGAVKQTNQDLSLTIYSTGLLVAHGGGSGLCTG